MTTTTLAPIALTTAITVDGKALAAALRTVKIGIAGRRAALDILNDVRLTATPYGLQLSTFDYESSAVLTIPADGPDSLDVSVSHEELCSVLKGVKARELVTLKALVDGADRLEVIRDMGNSVLAARPVAEAVALPHDSLFTTTVLSVTAEHLMTAVAHVELATSRDSTLPVLTGILIDPTPDTGVELLATDRYRLAQYRLPVHSQDTAAVNVPGRALAAMVKALNPAEMVHVTRSATGIVRLQQRDATFTLLAIHGDYPRIRGIIPDSSALVVEAVAERSALLRAVDAAGARLARSRPVRLEGQGDFLQVIAPSDQDASAGAAFTASVLLSGYAGTWGVRAFNPQFLSQALAGKGAATVTMRAVEHAAKPIVITRDDVPALLVLLMPVRIPG